MDIKKEDLFKFFLQHRSDIWTDAQ